MRGKVVEYNETVAVGTILGSDKNLYNFSEQDWWEVDLPSPDQNVDFLEQDGAALAVTYCKSRN